MFTKRERTTQIRSYENHMVSSYLDVTPVSQRLLIFDVSALAVAST